MNQPRHRIVYSLLAVAAMLVGLASRSSWAVYLPPFVAEYAGDTLWGLLLYLTLGVLRPRLGIAKAALLILCFSFAIEFSQLYQAAWINRIRANGFAALVLGKSFVWTDLPCYAAGVLLGVGVDMGWLAVHKRRDACETLD